MRGRRNATAGHGIRVLGMNNTIGGATIADRNVIAGNWVRRLHRRHRGERQRGRPGNLLGTDATGTVLVQNNSNDIDINTGAANNVIGGTSGRRQRDRRQRQRRASTIWGSGDHGQPGPGQHHRHATPRARLQRGNRGRGVIIAVARRATSSAARPPVKGNVIAFNVTARRRAVNDTASVQQRDSRQRDLRQHRARASISATTGVTANDAGDARHGRRTTCRTSRSSPRRSPPARSSRSRAR